jgi:hypothetical protein
VGWIEIRKAVKVKRDAVKVKVKRKIKIKGNGPFGKLRAGSFGCAQGRQECPFHMGERHQQAARGAGGDDVYGEGGAAGICHGEALWGQPSV